MNTINSFSLCNKNIIITGASSGIGRQTAISCSQMGARLLLIGRNKNRLDETLNQLHQPEQHLSFLLDLTDYENVETILQEGVSKIGKFHGIVHSAGITTTRPIKMVQPSKLDHFISTNVTSAINLTRLFISPKYISNDGGSIVFISSIMGIVGEVGKTIYSITKGALNSGARSLALELASKKIRVNTISPGVVITPMSDQAVFSQDEEARKRIIDLHPLGLGQPEDIANGCVYLLSDSSKWITGSNLVIDGGYTAR